MDGVIEDMWTPYKRLYETCQSAIRNPNELNTDLMQCLKKHKQNFTNLLRNPPKNEKSRAQLANTNMEGIMLAGQSRKTELSQDLINEAIILSDMYDLDEIFALELLCTAQRQQMHHPGLPRGLVAILLYYDGRKAISCTLRDMCQIVSGVSWTTEVPKEMTVMINNYVQNLVEDSNILGRILELLVELDTDKEINLLTKNRAFGSKRHRNQVLTLYEGTRKALAMALFNWSAQRGLTKNVAIRLLQQLAKMKPSEVTVIMLMALLYAYDTSVLLLAECENKHISRLPILHDPDYAKSFYEAIYAQTTWQMPQMDVIVKYSFGLTLASLRQSQFDLQINAAAILGNNWDEQLIDEALAGNIFSIFHRKLLEYDVVYETDFIYRRLHLLITDFIDFMHAKVSELRGRSHETARVLISYQSAGLSLESPPPVEDNFELLMLCVAKLYGDKRSKFTLCNEYWGPTNCIEAHSALNTANNYAPNNSRSVSLFKFIRLASEVLPQTLVVAYLEMIAGLTRTEFAARCAFHLLKDSESVQATYAVSWDHFFHGLNTYFNNMRNDHHTIGDSIYRSHLTPRLISPKETDLIIAVMGIVRAVAEHDDISRIMICEQANWKTPQVLLGLVACATTVALKGEILMTLAALSKSKESARSIWFHLEESQIIPTIPSHSTSMLASFSLAEEIVQNECRIETYKLSRGILKLLYNLMTTHMPHRLGAGLRIPGYNPYMHFIADTIFLKFNNRAYKDPVERWEVGIKCLQLMYFVLATYRPKTSDFETDRDEHPHPGHFIMMQLQVKSDMLRIVLRIIEEARELLDDYNEFHGKAILEECALYALLLIEVALAKQNAFFEAANCSTLMMGLNRMLLDLNPKTRRPDYVHTIIKFVTYNAWLPRHTLAAIKILSCVTAQPDVVAQILNMYAPNSTDKLEIRRPFLECLEMNFQCGANLKDDKRDLFASIEQFVYTHPSSDTDTDTTTTEDASESVAEIQDLVNDNTTECPPPPIELKIKESIVHLFEVNVNQPIPNFVTFLLGIDVTRDFMHNEQIRFETNSCINSLVLMLERHLEDQRQSETYCEHTARIVERTYRLFHGLCANHQTSEAILRYFRLNCNDFLLRHLAAMPFRNNHKNHMLHAISHLMNCVSIEIRVAASHSQTTRYTLLCETLLAVNGETLHNGHAVPLELSSSILMPAAAAAGGQYGMDMTPGRQMMQTPELHANRVLDCLTLETLSLTQPDLEFFDDRLLSTVFKDCTAAATMQHGAGMINIQKLHEVLLDELHLVHSTITNGQRKSIIDEITTIMQYAINLNSVRMERLASFAFMKAWCNLVQLLFSAMPETVLPITLRKQHIIDIVENIMLKVPPTQPLVTLSVLVTDTVLVLLENLRRCYYHLEDQRALDEHGNIISMSDHAATVDARESNNANNPTRVIGSVSNNSCKSSSLRFILKRLIAWIMTCEVKSQKLNINLYTSLLYCLRIVKRVRNDEQIEFNETLRSRSKSLATFVQQDTDQELNHTEMAAEIISEFGDKLIDTICHDVTTGHAVCSMLALTCLVLISELRAISNLTDIIKSRGYLKQILYGLSQSNEELKDVLKPIPNTLRPLFLYESVMAFLMQISQTYVGATAILSEGALGILANMSIYDMQPDLKASELSVKQDYTDAFLPAVDERFRSILLPALSLCDSIIDSLGVRNASASTQLLNFLFSHIDMIESMLRAATPFMDLGHLKQLAAITNLFARIACTEKELLNDNYDSDDSETNVSSHAMSSRLCHLRQLMIVVFGRFTINEATIRCSLNKERHGQTDQPEPSDEEKNQHVKYVLDIAANLSLYCRSGVTSHVRDDMTSKYLLTTMINDVTPLSGKKDSKKLSAIMLVILNQLKGSITYYLSEKSIADNLVQQQASLPNITFGPSDKQSYMELSQRHNDKRSELKMAVFIAEQNLYLLWIHVDFYLRNAVIYTQENRSFINETSSDPHNMSVLNASQDEITQLKQRLISTFNELFCSQIITASEGFSTKCKNFSAVLLRRIKALVQFAPQTK